MQRKITFSEKRDSFCIRFTLHVNRWPFVLIEIGKSKAVGLNIVCSSSYSKLHPLLTRPCNLFVRFGRTISSHFKHKANTCSQHDATFQAVELHIAFSCLQNLL